MGFKEVSSSREYKGWKLWSEGDYVIGIYKDNGEQESDYGMQQWFDIEVEESNFGFKSNRPLRLNGCGSLNSKMEEIGHGARVKIQYDGIGTMPKGKFKGKDFTDVKVFVADDAAPTTKARQDYSGL